MIKKAKKSVKNIAITIFFYKFAVYFIDNGRRKELYYP